MFRKPSTTVRTGDIFNLVATEQLLEFVNTPVNTMINASDKKMLSTEVVPCGDSHILVALQSLFMTFVYDYSEIPEKCFD